MNLNHGKNLLFAGVGGQGILLVAELTAHAAIHAGFDAKKTEVHGAAQRGGSVVSHVRFSQKVYSPLIPIGEVDVLLALEKLEGLRWAHYVRPGGLIVLNNEERLPQPMTEKKVEYPKNIQQFLEGKGLSVKVIDANAIAIGLGNFRVANTVLLGAIALQTGINDEHWIAVMKELLNPKILDLNLKAFEEGKEIAFKMNRSAVM